MKVYKEKVVIVYSIDRVSRILTLRSAELLQQEGMQDSTLVLVQAA